ncbi:MAG: DUF1592 domain-containing protein [Planctomycetota bacterium]|jgi:mono/diheme cytochrome c family protein
MPTLRLLRLRTVIVAALPFSLWIAAISADVVSADDPAVPSRDIDAFFESHCVACHAGADAEGGLDLASLGSPIESASELKRWIRIIDRVRDGEMPPPDDAELTPQQRTAFLTESSDWLTTLQIRQWQQLGRVRARRLTRLQIERTLHDLLGIDIPLANQLPEEPRTAGFTTVSDGQPMSHFQIQAHLEVVDAALDEAFRRATGAPDEWTRELSAQQLARQNPRRRCREPELIDDKAVTWSGGVTFYGRLPATTARQGGWYRFKVKASALNVPEEHGVWCTVKTGPCVSSAPLLGWVGAFEATGEPQEWTFETWLPAGHMLEIRPGDVTLKQARFRGGQIGTGEGAPQNVPGVALHEVVMERIHRGPGNWAARNTLFGDLEVKRGQPAKKIAARKWSKPVPGEVISQSPEDDVARLIRRFAGLAFRRPAPDADAAPYVALAKATLEDGASLQDALRSGYRALLCSPRFLYFHEAPGKLDDYAIASRLSYFLWNSMPDAELRKAAASGRLHEKWMLRKQVERMLEGGHGRQFVQDFAAEWLDLNLIDFTQPDRRMFRDFDQIVQQSMLNETHAFLQQMLDEDLTVRRLIQADETFLNSRLARYYGIENVSGDGLRPVSLQPEHRRGGGVLTHGSILKVTANGTNTSPVIRGIWVSERLLGVDVPAPPTNVPAIEPDIRGAKTIREMLAKHRSDPSCAACHVKIDPPGFALENYDPAGRWRDQYVVVNGRRIIRGAAVDASYDLPDGRHFEDVNEFQQLVAAQPKTLAANVAGKLITYGTGAPVTFADRKDIDQIVASAAEQNFGFRSLITEVVTSRVFTTK